MCGITAIFSYRDGPSVDPAEILRIGDRMTPRGPDGAGVWVSYDGRIGLAHRRLAIIDLSANAGLLAGVAIDTSPEPAGSQ
jgi:asparagine synthase (glutamine-hydrolysing)